MLDRSLHVLARAASSSTRSPATRARAALPAQPQLLDLRRLPRRRRRRARQDFGPDRWISYRARSRREPRRYLAAEPRERAQEADCHRRAAVRVRDERLAADRRLRDDLFEARTGLAGGHPRAGAGPGGRARTGRKGAGRWRATPWGFDFSTKYWSNCYPTRPEARRERFYAQMPMGGRGKRGHYALFHFCCTK